MQTRLSVRSDARGLWHGVAEIRRRRFSGRCVAERWRWLREEAAHVWAHCCFRNVLAGTLPTRFLSLKIDSGRRRGEVRKVGSRRLRAVVLGGCKQAIGFYSSRDANCQLLYYSRLIIRISTGIRMRRCYYTTIDWCCKRARSTTQSALLSSLRQPHSPNHYWGANRWQLPPFHPLQEIQRRHFPNPRSTTSSNCTSLHRIADLSSCATVVESSKTTMEQALLQSRNRQPKR